MATLEGHAKSLIPRDTTSRTCPEDGSFHQALFEAKPEIVTLPQDIFLIPWNVADSKKMTGLCVPVHAYNIRVSILVGYHTHAFFGKMVLSGCCGSQIAGRSSLKHARTRTTDLDRRTFNAVIRVQMFCLFRLTVVRLQLELRSPRW